MSKLEVFEFLKKIESLVLARNALKRSVLMVGIFWRKFFFGKTLVLELWPETLSANQIARIFKS